MSTTTVNTVDNATVKPEFIVVPSTVYNNKIMETLKEVAEKYEGLSVHVSNSFSLKYVLSYAEYGKSVDMDPFASSEHKSKWRISYDPRFSEYRNDNPFFKVEKKQVFFSQSDFDEYFKTIKDNVEEWVENNVEEKD